MAALGFVTAEPTLGQFAEEAEARLFVGRRAELEGFGGLLEGLTARPAAIYVSGPPGIGKSALLRAFAREARARGFAALRLDLGGLAGSSVPGEPAGPRAAAAAEEALGLDGLRRPGVLLLDSYDALGREEAAFRSRVLAGLGAGVGVVLAGRVPGARLWADALPWRASVRELALPGLTPAEMDAFLDLHGLGDPTVRQAVADLCGGQPRLLTRAAAAVAADPAWVAELAEREPEGLAAFLLERILHPGSRRRAWRASGADDLVAAASLLPHLDRPALTAVVGRQAVERGWDALTELACEGGASPQGAFPEPFRRSLHAALLTQRPWIEGRWRRRLIGHLCRRAQVQRPGDDPAEDWLTFAAAAREAPWHPGLHPAAARSEGWRVECASPAPAPWVWSVRVGDAAGASLGGAAGCPLGEACRAPQPGARLAAYLRDLGPAGREAWAADTLLVSLTSEEPSSREVGGVLLRQAGRRFHRFGRVVVLGPGAEGGCADVLPLLGFRWDPPRQGGPGAWVLDFGPGGYPGWLRQITLPPPGPEPEQWAMAAKAALAVVDEPARLPATLAGQRYRALHHGQGVPEAIRAWVIDAVMSCGLQGPQATLITQYYLEHSGPHELLSERHDLPRATYYRIHRLALERIGEALFG